MIGIIDYKMGNVQSVLNAVTHVGGQGRILSSPADFSAMDKLILPGVGAFGAGMDSLRSLGMIEPLARFVREQKKPFLGICLGMQLLCKESFEFGRHAGLGWFDAAVREFDKSGGLRSPHMGWNTLKIQRDNKLVREGPDVYFVHSFYVDAAGADFVTATCDYGVSFAAALERDNVYATQFHLEKSQQAGLDILKRFCEL